MLERPVTQSDLQSDDAKTWQMLNIVKHKEQFLHPFQVKQFSQCPTTGAIVYQYMSKIGWFWDLKSCYYLLDSLHVTMIPCTAQEICRIKDYFGDKQNPCSWEKQIRLPMWWWLTPRHYKVSFEMLLEIGTPIHDAVKQRSGWLCQVSDQVLLSENKYFILKVCGKTGYQQLDAWNDSDWIQIAQHAIVTRNKSWEFMDHLKAYWCLQNYQWVVVLKWHKWSPGNEGSIPQWMILHRPLLENADLSIPEFPKTTSQKKTQPASDSKDTTLPKQPQPTKRPAHSPAAKSQPKPKQPKQQPLPKQPQKPLPKQPQKPLPQQPQQPSPQQPRQPKQPSQPLQPQQPQYQQQPQQPSPQQPQPQRPQQLSGLSALKETVITNGQYRMFFKNSAYSMTDLQYVVTNLGELIDLESHDAMIVEFKDNLEQRFQVVFPFCFALVDSNVHVAARRLDLPSDIVILPLSAFHAKLSHFDRAVTQMLMPHLTARLDDLYQANIERALCVGDYLEFYFVQPHMVFQTRIGRMIWNQKLAIHLTHGFSTKYILATIMDPHFKFTQTFDGCCDTCCLKHNDPLFHDSNLRVKCKVCALLSIAIFNIGVAIGYFRQEPLCDTTITRFQQQLFPVSTIDDFD